LLNIWFLVALALAEGYRLSDTDVDAWSQALAWLIGAAAWIAFVVLAWLVRGRASVTTHFPEIPGSTEAVPLPRPIVLFAVIRAVAVSGAVAIAFGLSLPNADWMPVAALVALKPSLAQSRLVAEQRLVGAVIGATLAVVFLLTLDNRPALAVVVIVFLAIGVSIRSVNYALYCGAIAAGVLIAMDIPHPTDLAAEGQRILFTFLGVAIAVACMFLANLLRQRSTAPTSKATPATSAA
jgi:uncharacterized membrane protein YccC